MIDPISGNVVPPGAMPQEVRDDVPIAASEGEYVLPADVVRFIGLDKIEKLVQQAKEGMSTMGRTGRIGGEAPPPPMPPAPQQDPGMPMMARGGMVKRGYSEGGLVDNATRAAVTNPMPFYGSGTRSSEMMEYVDETGRVMFIPMRNGQPLMPIPSGFFPRTPGSAPQAEADRDGGLEDNTTPSGPRPPMTYDELMEQATGIGRERPALETTLLQGLGALGPVGAMATRAVEFFQRQNADRVQTTLQRTLDTGVDPSGQQLSQAQLESLAGELGRISGTPVTAPRAAQPVTPRGAHPVTPEGAHPVTPLGVPAMPGEITQTPLLPLGASDNSLSMIDRARQIGSSLVDQSRNSLPVHDYRNELSDYRNPARSLAEQISGPESARDTMGVYSPPSRPTPVHDYRGELSPGNFSETSEQVSGPSSTAGGRGSAAPPSRPSGLGAASGRGTNVSSETRDAVAAAGGYTGGGRYGGFNKGGLVTRSSGQPPANKMYKGGLIKRPNN